MPRTLRDRRTDASAILAFLQDEEGSNVVEGHMVDDARAQPTGWRWRKNPCSAGRDWSLSRALLTSYRPSVENVTESDGSGRRPGGVVVRDFRWATGCAYRWRTGCRRRR
jgi:hypothetical protein